MRAELAQWVRHADALHHIQLLGFQQTPLLLSYVTTRRDDYYLSLIGELFHRMRAPYTEPVEWSRLGNAILQAGARVATLDQAPTHETLPSEPALFAATAFYIGGYPASAYLILKAANTGQFSESYQACYELLARPAAMRSQTVRALIRAVRQGNLQAIRDISTQIEGNEARALLQGPEEWIGLRLLSQMVERFKTTNIRAVLPGGQDQFWDTLVQSLVNRTPPVWDFFPSQIEAINSGLLGSGGCQGSCRLC